jgi:hypothetical protein
LGPFEFRANMRPTFLVMPGLGPRLSGLVLVDKAHGVDSSAS